MRDAMKQDLNLIAAVDSIDSVEHQRKVLLAEGVVLDSIVATPFRENGIVGVPMAMTIDGHGVIGDV